jgi:predicted permease
MNLLDLFSLQGTLFALMIVGAILKKKEIIDANGKKCLTDLCINVVIPCNIFKSCLIEFNMEIFRSCALLLLAAAIFAARYDSDALFATRCVVMTTLMSMLTLPVWCYLAG